MSYDEPFSLDFSEHDKIDSESLLAGVRRLVAGNRVSEIFGTFQTDNLDPVDVIMSIDAALNIGFDPRARVHKAGTKCSVR
jgi:glutamate/tyrosine decarboxylase-like PLP-dependent enzyme